jgi:hypothetical protein
MSMENPYQAPASPSALDVGRAPRRWSVVVIGLVALQTLVAALYVSTALGQLRRGETSAVVFLAWASASVLLALGAPVLLRNPRLAAYLFFASAASSGLACLQWRPTFVFTGLLIALCAGLVGFVSARRAG